MKRWLRLTITAIMVVIILFVTASGLVGYFATKVSRKPLAQHPSNVGLAYSDVSFTSREDQLLLRGWYLPALRDSDEAIILVHGADGNRIGPDNMFLEIARGLVMHGYNVLMFDLRGHGESEGEHLTGGLLEQRDLLGAVDYVKSLGLQRIGVIGFSMGAVTSILAAGNDPDIKAVIADSGFANLTQMIEPIFSQYTKLPGYFMLPLFWVINLIYHIDFTSINPVNSVSKIAPRPVMYIHGTNDALIPDEQSIELAQATPNSSLWIVPNATHTRSYLIDPQEYMSRILTFFNDALDGTTQNASAYASAVSWSS